MKNARVVVVILLFLSNYCISQVLYAYGSGNVETNGNEVTIKTTQCNGSTYVDISFSNDASQYIVTPSGGLTVNNFGSTVSISFDNLDTNYFSVLDVNGLTKASIIVDIVPFYVDSLRVDEYLGRVSNDTLKYCTVVDDQYISLRYMGKPFSDYEELDMCYDDIYIGAYINNNKQASTDIEDWIFSIGDILQFKRSYGGFSCCNNMDQASSFGGYLDTIYSKKFVLIKEQNVEAFIIGPTTGLGDTVLCPSETKYVKRHDSDPYDGFVTWWSHNNLSTEFTWDSTWKDSTGTYSPKQYILSERLSGAKRTCPRVSNTSGFAPNNNCKGCVYGFVSTHQNTNSPNIPNVKVSSDKGQIVFTDSMGHYWVFFDPNEIVDSLLFEKPGYKSIHKAVYGYDQKGTYLRSLMYPVLTPDREDDISISGRSGRNRPGFTIPYFVYLENFGKTDKTVDVKIQLDQKQSYEINVLENKPDSISDGMLFWKNITVKSAQKTRLNFFSKLDRTTSLGSILNVTGLFTGNTDDWPSNDTTNYHPEVTGSFDPNDKDAEYIGHSNGDKIHDSTAVKYTIRFQNTGTDTAFTVVVKDKITGALDISSIEMIDASHNYILTIVEDTLIWTFNNILLIDSTANEPGSHGFITFIVKQKTGNPEFTEIKNKAFIYFDFNDPIITNEEVSVIDYELITWTNEIGVNSLKLYPNPTRDIITIKNDFRGVSTYEIISGLGKKILTGASMTNQVSINVTSLAPGSYIVVVSNENGTSNSLTFVRK